ncbi:hypothetical protein FACS1894193_00950 [Bacilli bacterium]|nr:hypothetical protein FACS1894193_00950 [Bacilli bacterium]
MDKFKTLYHNSLFKKYFLNYFLIFLLPFLILTGILYYILSQHTREQIISDNHATLNRVDQALDSEFTSLDKIADDLATNTNLNPYYLKNPLYATQTKNELQRYMITNKDLVKEIFIYYAPQNIIYSRSGTLSTDAFTTYKYPKTALTAADLTQNFKTKQQLLTSSDYLDKRQGQLLQYFVPVTNKNANLTILFIFDQEKFNDFLSQHQLQPNQDITFYQNGTPFASTTQTLANSDKKTKMISTQKKFRTSQIKVGLSRNVLVQKLNSLKITFVILGLASLLFGLGLIFLICQHIYAPIAKLNEEFNKIVKDELNSEIEGDFFSNVSKHLSNQHLVIQAELENHQELLKDVFWHELIQGLLSNQYEVASKMRDCGLKPNPTATYFLGLISTDFSADKIDNLKQKTVIIKQLKQKHLDCKTHLVELPFENRLAIIFELNHTATLNLAIQNWLFDCLPINSVIFFSQSKHQLLDLSTAYIEALTILEHIDISADAQRIHFYDSSELSKQTPLDFKLNKTLQLIAAIKENSMTLIEKLLRELTDEHFLATLPINIRHHYASNLFNHLITLINQENLPVTETIFHQLDQPLLTSHLYETLSTLSYEIATNIANLKHSKSSMQKQAIITYLHDNFRNPDFSLENFAATFNVSTTFLTKFIKQETGQSFAKMVAELKLDYIKLELIETDRPIKQIIYDAGYYDVSNFTRKFRKLIGLTPGDYRKHHKELNHAEKNPAL